MMKPKFSDRLPKSWKLFFPPVVALILGVVGVFLDRPTAVPMLFAGVVTSVLLFGAVWVANRDNPKFVRNS